MENNKSHNPDKPLQVTDQELASGIAFEPSDKIKDTDTPLNEGISHDGMTAATARNTGGGDEHTPTADHSYDPNENPGKKFNINDQAHSQSSKEDFVKTVSNFSHSDGSTPPSQVDSQHLSPD